jgi:hypothetical protein
MIQSFAICVAVAATLVLGLMVLRLVLEEMSQWASRAKE